MTVWLREVGVMMWAYARLADGSVYCLGKFRNPKHWY